MTENNEVMALETKKMIDNGIVKTSLHRALTSESATDLIHSVDAFLFDCHSFSSLCSPLISLLFIRFLNPVGSWVLLRSHLEGRKVDRWCPRGTACPPVHGEEANFCNQQFDQIEDAVCEKVPRSRCRCRREPSTFDILQGHSRATIFLICNNAAQGILSSFFFKYADIILKKYSSIVATIFTGIAFAALFGHTLTINFILGISIMFILMHQFFTLAKVKDEVPSGTIEMDTQSQRKKYSRPPLRKLCSLS